VRKALYKFLKDVNLVNDDVNCQRQDSFYSVFVLSSSCHLFF